MPDGAWSISFKGGFRAVLIDVPNEKQTRRYFGLPLEVPFYLEDAWSTCTPPSDDEASEILRQRGNNPGERVEAICRIDVDGDIVVRGAITSVPDL